MMFLLLLCLATANAGLVRREEKFQRYNEDTMEDDLKEFMEKVTTLAVCNSEFDAAIEACGVCVQNECGQEMKVTVPSKIHSTRWKEVLKMLPVGLSVD